MEIKDLLENIPYMSFEGNLGGLVNKIEVDSRAVNPNDIFVCIKGETVDGHKFIDKAVNNGATTIVVQDSLNQLHIPPNVSVLRVRDTKKTLTHLCSTYYDFPSEDMDIIGVTGTNGKTSITHFLKQMFQWKGINTGLIGTINHQINNEVIPSKNTTPMTNELQELLHQMKINKVEKVFMEVSSHGLSMGRVDGIPFKHALFTNLTQDHLDFHGTMKEYGAAKGILFESLGFGLKDKKFAIFNADDTASNDYMKKVGNWILTYGIIEEADIQALNIHNGSNGISFDFTYKGKTYRAETAVIGYYNIYNLLAVISLCIAEGWAIEDIVEGLKVVKPVKGRMEIVPSEKDFTVIIDYAHTPDGVLNALSAVSPKGDGRIITVLGCGGDRDRSKRPIMASTAETLSHTVILTSDNPRTEDPLKILKDMEEGLEKDDYLMYANREIAIMQAIAMAKEDDIVFILGKGHEEFQIIGLDKLPFSDVEIASKYILK